MGAVKPGRRFAPGSAEEAAAAIVSVVGLDYTRPMTLVASRRKHSDAAS
jgi:hypothetical protein